MKFEDEVIIPAEENNCFALDPSSQGTNLKCEILSNSRLTTKDRLNCGTIRCPFYKPAELENSIRHIVDKNIAFESLEEYEKKHEMLVIRRGNEKDYETHPHADEESVKISFCKYVKENRIFSKLTLAELQEYAEFIGLPIEGMKKKEAVDLIKNFI